MAIKWIGMSDEMKKRIRDVIIVAPWRELNLISDKNENKEQKYKKKKMIKMNNMNR